MRASAKTGMFSPALFRRSQNLSTALLLNKTMPGSGIKEEQPRIFTFTVRIAIELNAHLAVTDVLSAVKCSFPPGLYKHLVRKASQKETH